MAENTDNLQKIASSGLGIAVGFIISGVLSVLTRILLGRFLGPEGYGLLSEGLAVMNFFVIFALLGTDQGVTRFISFNQDGEKSVFSALHVTFPLSILLAGAVFLSSDFIAGFMGSPDLGQVIRFFSLNIPAYTGLTTIVSGFRGEKRTKEKVFLSDTALPVTILLLSVPIAIISGTAGLTAIGYLAAGWTTFFVGAILYLRNRSFYRPPLEKMEKIIRFSFPLSIGNYASFGLIWANIVLLGFFIESSSAGLYNAALPISYSLTLGLSAVNYIFLPLTSSAYSEDRPKEIREMYSLVVRWLTMFSLPLLVVLVTKSGFIVTTLFGSSFSAASSALIILSLGRFVDVFTGPLGQVLVGLGDTKKEAVSKTAGLAVLLISGAFLIPELGVTGASLGFLAGFSLTNLLRLVYSRRKVKLNPFSKDLLKPVIASLTIVPLLFVPEIESTALNFTSIILAGFIYLTVLMALKPLKEEDIETFDEFAKGRIVQEKREKILELMQKCR